MKNSKEVTSNELRQKCFDAIMATSLYYQNTGSCDVVDVLGIEEAQLVSCPKCIARFFCPILLDSQEDK